MYFDDLYKKQLLQESLSTGLDVDRMLFSKLKAFKFVDVVNKIPEYPELKKYTILFKGIDLEKIANLLYDQFVEQLNAISQTCVNRYGLSTNNLKQIERIIVDHIGTQQYQKILMEVTDYSLFKSSVFGVYAVIGVLALAMRSKLLLTLNVMTYSIFVYTKMLKKYSKFCRPEILEVALTSAHGNSAFANFMKQGGHIAFVEYIAISELNKFLAYKKFTPKHYTRMYTYIKHRFNQSLKNFFNSTYYKFFKKYKSEIAQANIEGHVTVTSSHLSILLEDIMNSYETISEIPRTYVETLSQAIGLDKEKGYLISKVFLNMVQSNNTYKKLLREFYTRLIQYVPYSDLKDICGNLYFKRVVEFISSKRPEAITLRKMWDQIISEIIKKVSLPKSKYKDLFKFLIYLNYFVFVKKTVCG